MFLLSEVSQGYLARGFGERSVQGRFLMSENSMPTLRI